MKLAYIIGPYRAKTAWEMSENITLARRAAMAALRLGLGAWCPHLNTAFMDGLVDDSFFLRSGLALIERLDRWVDCVIVCGDWQNSAGSKAEVELARRRKLPIFEYVEVAGWKEYGRLLCIEAGSLNDDEGAEGGTQERQLDQGGSPRL